MSEPDPIFHDLGPADDVDENCGRPYTVDGVRLAVVRSGGKLFALDDLCTHANATIALGPVENGCIACPWHFAEFDLATGKALSGPATGAIRTHQIREREGRIEVALAPGEPEDVA